ncbi:MAG: hypothetical protein JWP97_1160 [Labilithrix sp.]|nr:hypothetical protein [Labilithrix sp.]
MRATLLVAAALLAGCEERGHRLTDAAAPPPIAPGPSAPVHVPAAAPTGDADAPRKDCRIMSSEGGPAASADPDAWLDVAAQGTFSVRTLDTGRELRFEGPGRVRACGGEVALLAEGSAVGLPGSGEAPGSEQWVASAFGAARWASGVHRMTAAKDSCKVQVSTGALELYVAEDVSVSDVTTDGGDAPRGDPASTRGGFRHIVTRRTLLLTPRGPSAGTAAVKTALTACERAAAAVSDLAARMNGGDAGALGELAAESVSARGTARAACAVAEVRVYLAGGRPDDRAKLAAAVARFRTSP